MVFQCNVHFDKTDLSQHLEHDCECLEHDCNHLAHDRELAYLGISFLKVYCQTASTMTDFKHFSTTTCFSRFATFMRDRRRGIVFVKLITVSNVQGKKFSLFYI